MPGRRFGRRVLRSAPLAAAGWLLLPTAQAHAHTTFPGLGEFASGFLHPLTTPPHLLVLVTLGLWLGQRAPLRLKEPVAAFAGAALVGLALTVAAHVGGINPVVLIVVGLVVGAGVALAVPVRFWVKTIVCGLAALALGLDSGVEGSIGDFARTKILFATWVSLLLCVVNVAFYVSLLPPVRWAQIGVRVAGSWVTAIAFLLLAFALRR